MGSMVVCLVLMVRRFVYSTMAQGYHEICFTTTTSSWFNPLDLVFLWVVLIVDVGC